MRRILLVLAFMVGCSDDQAFDYDLEAIGLARAPLETGGPTVGGLLATVETSTGMAPLLVDTAFPINALRPGGCGDSPGWTYTGRVDIRDGSLPAAPLRASFRNVGLFDLCPGPTGDQATQAVGVVGGSLLANFVVDFIFPASPTAAATMTFWPGFPGTDDQLAMDGLPALRFELRGSATASRDNGESTINLPNSRAVLAACAAPRQFAVTEAAETCAKGEVALRASGADLLLAIGTGEGPIILGESAWARVAARVGVSEDEGAMGSLFTPFSAAAVPARFLTLPRLALLQSTIDSSWTGPCAELARARRIEWVMANQDSGACFQPCDADGDRAVSTRPYLELGGDLRVAIVEDTSDLMRSLNADSPPKPRVDGVIGAGALVGTRLRLDYLAKPQGRVIASCLGADRATCFAAPSCPGLSEGQRHTCFGQPERGYAPVCQP